MEVTKLFCTFVGKFTTIEYKRKDKTMDAMLFCMTGVAIIAVGIALWTNTKSGKRWIESL